MKSEPIVTARRLIGRTLWCVAIVALGEAHTQGWSVANLKVMVAMKTARIVTTLILVAALANTAHAQWVLQSPIPTGRHLNSVYFITPTHGFVCGINRQLLETTDGGATWITRMSDALGTDPFYNVTFSDSLHGYMTGNVYDFRRDAWRTTDGGQTWNQMNNFPIGSWHLIDFITPTRVYVGSNGACAFTSDGGDTWTIKSGYPDAPVMFGMDFRDEQVGLAGGLGLGQNPDGIFKTTNGGTTWRQKSSHIANDVLWWTDQVALAAADGGASIYRSTNAGESWSLFGTGITTGLTQLERIDNMRLAGVSGGGDIWRSTDEGLTWTQVFDGPGDLPTEWSLRFVDNLHGWLVGQSGFIFTSDDGGLTWRQVNNGVGVQLYDIEMQTNDFGMAVGHNGYVFRTTNGGNWWDVQKLQVTGQIFGRDESLHGISIVDSGFAVVAGPGGTVFRTTNGGTSWQSIGYPNLPDGFWIEDVKFITRNDGWLVGLDTDLGHAASVYRTTDGGTTWVQAMNQNSYMYAVDFVDPQHGWIATIGELYFRTTNGGTTWMSGTLPSTGSLTVSDMQFANQQVGWAVGWSGFVVRTIDGGASWTVQNIGTTEDHLFSVHVVSSSEAWLTGREADPLTMNGVVYHTTNGGTTWTREVVAPNPYWGYAITGSGGNVWIAGYEGRILKKLGPTGVKEDQTNASPSGFQLAQNFPNPFNPSTTLSFSIPSSSFVILKVYDMLGKEVRTLVNENKPAGIYGITFDATGLPSGLYFYRLQAGGQTITRKMLLVK